MKIALILTPHPELYSRGNRPPNRLKRPQPATEPAKHGLTPLDALISLESLLELHFCNDINFGV